MNEGIDEGLRGELQQQGVWVTSMQELYNWGRKNSIWPLQFGLACCAIEMIATSMARYDIGRPWEQEIEDYLVEMDSDCLVELDSDS